MSDDFGTGSLLDNEFERTPSLTWADAKPGQKLIVKIVELPTQTLQRKDFDDKTTPLFWPLRPGETEQKPKLNTFTKFEILDGSDNWTQNAEQGETDDAHEAGQNYNWWINLPSQPWTEFKLKNKLLKQDKNDPRRVKTTFNVRKGEDIVLGAEYDKHRHGLSRSFAVGDVLEIKLAEKKIIKGRKPQNIFEITWLRYEPLAVSSPFDDADA